MLDELQWPSLDVPAFLPQDCGAVSVEKVKYNTRYLQGFFIMESSRCNSLSDCCKLQHGGSIITFKIKPTTLYLSKGAQWLSGRVLDSRPKGRGFEPHRRHCVVVLEQDTFILA